MEKMSGEAVAEMFAAGAYSAAVENGMSEKDAEAFTMEVCKQASSRDDEGDTWWGRNKGWLLPTLIGTGAFLIGNDAGKNGRADRNAFQNAGSLFMKRIRALLGISSDPMFKSLTQVHPEPEEGQ